MRLAKFRYQLSISAGAGHMDVSSKKYTFSKRGKAFFLQVAKRTAQHLRDADV